MSKVLIAYGSQILNLRKTKSKEWPLLKEFDGVLVGSGIKIGKWAKEPKAQRRTQQNVENSNKGNG